MPDWMRAGTLRSEIARPVFQADEDFNARIIAGVLRREPAIDIQTAKSAGTLGVPDTEVLTIAARAGRILLSHDRDTMPTHFTNFTTCTSSPGLLVVSQRLPVREVIEQIVLIWNASEAHE